MDAFDFFVQMGLMGQPHVYRYEVVFAKYDRKTDTFEEMSCFDSLKLQNQRAKLRREKKKTKNTV